MAEKEERLKVRQMVVAFLIAVALSAVVGQVLAPKPGVMIECGWWTWPIC